MAQVAATKQQPISADYPEENIAKLLRRFTSQHTTLLGWAGFQALQLKRMPSNVRQSALLIEVSPRPSSDPHRQCVISTPSISPDRFTLMPPPHFQVHRQGHTHRATHIRHIPRPTRGRGHPAPRGTLPPRRRHRHRSRADPVRRGEPGDAGRGRLARKDLVGRAERLGGGARALCRHRPVGLQADLDDREGVSDFFSASGEDPHLC